MILNATPKVGSPIFPILYIMRSTWADVTEIQYLTKADMKSTRPFSFFVCFLEVKLNWSASEFLVALYGNYFMVDLQNCLVDTYTMEFYGLI